MAPKHQLTVSVGLVAAAIAIAWFVLFREHVLAPPVKIPARPSLPDIGRQFEEQAEAFNKLVPSVSVEPTPSPSAASDDVRK